MVDAIRLELLQRLHPLKFLSAEGLRELIPICRLHAFARNSDPVHAAAWEGQVVYLLRGQLKVDHIDAGARVIVGSFEHGASPLIWNNKRPLKTKAITDVELLSLDEETLDIIVTWNQLTPTMEQSEQAGDATEWQKMSGLFTADSLTQGAFASLPPANIQNLLTRFQHVEVKRGDTLVRQGDSGDYYYLIESGRCRVSRQVANSQVELAELKEGDSFGEEALVADTPRNATVTMKTDGMLLRLSKQDFHQLLRAPLLQRLGCDAAQQKVAAGAQWIDVRFPAEYQADGFAGAINIPLNDIRQIANTLNPTTEYIVYCQTGRRSSAAAFLLSQRGLHAFLLEGGMRGCANTRESAA
ncbi:MAG TPA: cyclic nucleotide-binding domain-containing protein [Rhodocyclaceae bacterium]|nr:cyclic nucleotide-binding domain-containing protein [Rhodocyclaceae bacterium]